MFSGRRTSSSVVRNSCSISSSGVTPRLRGISTSRTASVEFVAQVGQERQLLQVEELGHPLDQAALLHLVGDLGDHDLVLAVASSSSPSARAAGSCRGRSGRPRRCWPRARPASRRSAGRGPGVAHQLLDVGGAVAGRRAATQRGQQLARIVRRDAGGHAHRDARGAVGQKVGEGRGQDDRLLVAAVVGWRGNRPRPRRSRRAGPWRPRSAGSRCSAWRRGYRRRCCRNCPGRRPGGSAGRSPAPGVPARRRPRRRRAGGTCRSRRRPRARIS